MPSQDAGSDEANVQASAVPAQGSGVGVPAQTRASVPPSVAPPPAMSIGQQTASVRALLTQHRDGAPLSAGAVVAEVLQAHPNYLDERLGWGDLEHAGELLAATAHVAGAASFWDPATTSVLRGRHVVLGLALDPEIGWPLLQSGVVHNLIALWQPIRRQHAEPDLVIWDLLSDAGRAAADEQPLLA